MFDTTRSPIMSIREIHQTGPYRYTYSPFHPPIATVEPGETVVIHTVDAFENKMTPEVRRFADVCTYPFLNPQTGPIVVNGAQPGDTLAVKIHDIVPTRDQAITGTIPYFGGLTSTKLDPNLQPPLEEQWLFLPIDDAGIHFDEQRVIPYEPFLAQVRHGDGCRSTKFFRMSVGLGKVCTTFGVKTEPLR